MRPLQRLEAERERRLAEKIEAGEIVSVPLCIVAGSEAEARAKVEQAKADKLAELRAAGDQREVVFDVTMVVTGVVRPGEATETEPWKPTAPPYLPRPQFGGTAAGRGRRGRSGSGRATAPSSKPTCRFKSANARTMTIPARSPRVGSSIDGKVLTVTDANGKYVGSRAMLEGEDARVVAKQLLREKKAPEGESFNRPLSYPNAGLA